MDHALTSKNSNSGDLGDCKWRDASDGGFFAFQMRTIPGAPQLLRCTYWGDDDGPRAFDILVDGKLLATQRLTRNRPGELFDVEYPLPAEMVAAKEKVTVRFQAHLKNFAGGLFRCATVRASD